MDDDACSDQKGGRVSGWLLLALAIVTEVMGTVALQLSDGFRRLVPAAIVVVGYGISFYLLALTLQRLEIGVTYAIWAGVGTALVAVIGVVFLGEPLNGAKVVGVVLVIAGVASLELGSQAA
jgi:small multidrug resistance pump